MATKKTTKKAAGKASAQDTASKVKGLEGKAPRGKEWDPSSPEAAAPDAREVNEPRPYTSRYPIPNEEFEALKVAAPKAKLAKITAARSKDSARKKEEIAARAMAPVALQAGLEPVAAPSGSANFAGIAATGW